MKRNLKSILLTSITTIMATTFISGSIFNATVFAGYNDKPKEVKEIRVNKNNERIIDYDEAIEMATKENSSLKEISDTIDFIDYSRSMMYRDNTLPELPDNGNYLVTAARFQKLIAVNGLNTQEKNLGISEDLTKLSIEAAVKSSMTTITALEKNYKLAKDALEIGKEQLSQTSTMYRMGMVSQIDYEKAMKEIANKEQELKQIELSIKQEYNSFRKLIGLKEDENFEIEYDIDFEPVEEITDMESYINTKIKTDLGLKIERANLDATEYGLNMFVDTGDGTEYEKRKLDNINAERSYKDNVKAKGNSIRNAYIGLKNSETERKVLESKLAQAKADFETAKVNYQVGNITKLNYDMANLAVIQAEVALEQHTLTYDINKFMFENTSLLGGGSPNNSSK